MRGAVAPCTSTILRTHAGGLMHPGRVDPCSRGPRSFLRWRWILLPSVAALGACAADGGMAPVAPAAAAAPQPGPMADMAEGMPPPPAPPPPPAQPVAPVLAAEPPPPPADGPFGGAAAKEAEKPMPEWAPVREFPAPSYAGASDGPRTDFRETIFWKP